MLARLPFQHRHAARSRMVPQPVWISRTILSITNELVCIVASTVPAFPVNFSCLAVCRSWLAFLSSQFSSHLGFHYLGDHASNCLLCHFLHVRLDLLQDRFPFLSQVGLSWRNCILIVLKSPCDKSVFLTLPLGDPLQTLF
jgi:hypothetical protein